MTDNLKIWNKLRQPPPEALKTIGGGRLKGKTDINPQWRYEALTEAFGMCGVGWKYEVRRTWTEPASDGQCFAFAAVNLYIKSGDEWSEPIPGIGGSMLIEKERNGLHSNDEAYKMAVTDALSVATKMVGVAADIYAGLWDGTKYAQRAISNQEAQNTISEDQVFEIVDLVEKTKADEPLLLKYVGAKTIQEMTVQQYNLIIPLLRKKLANNK